MKPITAIGLGEILWDVLPDGKKLGGAPANFAYHVNGLGGTGIPVSRIGNDDLGLETLAELQAHGVSTDHISIDQAHPTGTVDASIDANGVATYSFPEAVAWDFLTFDTETMALAAKADAICFGTLAQRSEVSRSAMYAFLEAAPDALKIYDINLRQDYHTPERIRNSLKLADVLKINDEELECISSKFSLPTDERAAMELLAEKFNLTLAVLTRGDKGSLILSQDGISDLAGRPTTVVDTIGAGDSFTAAMVLAYTNGFSLPAINEYATTVAAYVCGQAGAMPPMLDSLHLSRYSS